MYRSKHHVTTKSRVAEAEDHQVPFTFHDPKPCTKKNKEKKTFYDFFHFIIFWFTLISSTMIYQSLKSVLLKKLIENCSVATQVRR